MSRQHQNLHYLRTIWLQQLDLSFEVQNSDFVHTNTKYFYRLAEHSKNVYICFGFVLILLRKAIKAGQMDLIIEGGVRYADEQTT
ncbi:hypothetical protein MNBD_ALPHA08-2474 [hydrothermal vent metagenome]|uniref:Uncharacterized protein n=1 Tax=hydrothermal vent metagenome TaxID=652676 RepID=A0A3B0RQM5_9ZZZZ